MEGSGRQDGANPAGAVEGERGVPLRDEVLDPGLDEALAEMDSPGDVALVPLVLLADVDESAAGGPPRLLRAHLGHDLAGGGQEVSGGLVRHARERTHSQRTSTLDRTGFSGSGPGPAVIWSCRSVR